MNDKNINQKYYYDVEICKAKFNDAAKKSMNKYIGSDFDDFAREHNMVLKGNMNFAIKMLNYGKIVLRKSKPEIVIYPKNSNKSNHDTKLTVDDLFAEDWIVFQGKTFKEVLDDLYAGKTIRRKGWHDLLNIGKYGPNKILCLDDLYASDWESVDIVAEVDKIQKEHLNDRTEH